MWGGDGASKRRGEGFEGLPGAAHGGAPAGGGWASGWRRDAGDEADRLPDELLRELEQTGYYPQLLADVVLQALAGEPVLDALVHLETTFDADAVRRHVTVLALTATRLVTAHVDDHDPPETGGAPVAVASSESVPLSDVRSVVIGHRVNAPERYRAGAAPQELTLTVAWGTLSRLDVEPATCGDPECEADHGYTGTMTADDVSLRISADAEGEAAVLAARRFARSLTRGTRTSRTA
ncbi:hypothetical protein SAMN06264364_12631 [Quadrisphaera granulorum]|uniref:Phosphodiesterase n=1 Tax=Quadrisphaera granulorum TaxID=317664 RepID=A0A315ZWN4_9ACTN|nr:DUF5998 family protein [Quadrisphaera granulorum]PWJ49278.1 hypothetical protein BXY45_12631 [Quadrisphaera granulorum]SZE98195.1 hypothetical protein SAMN06264364_12631 [Quadrisphaera granulorum]